MLMALLLALLATPMVRASELTPFGTYYWSEDRAGFGGFSGLAVMADGLTLYAASDAGQLFGADISRGPSGAITHIETTWQGRFLDNFGNPAEGFTGDAEGLALAADGTLFVAFESYARIAAFRPPDMMPHPESAWDRFRANWGNAGFEALAILPEGQMLVIAEAPHQAGGYRTFLGQGMRWEPGPVLPSGEGFQAAGADVGPDGMLYLLERRSDLFARFSTRIRRFALTGDSFGAGETLLETKPGALDNMEGISLWRDTGGRTIITLISDDNFRFFQNTLVVEYVLTE